MSNCSGSGSSKGGGGGGSSAKNAGDIVNIKPIAEEGSTVAYLTEGNSQQYLKIIDSQIDGGLSDDDMLMYEAGSLTFTNINKNKGFKGTNLIFEYNQMKSFQEQAKNGINPGTGKPFQHVNLQRDYLNNIQINLDNKKQSIQELRQKFANARQLENRLNNAIDKQKGLLQDVQVYRGSLVSNDALKNIQVGKSFVLSTSVTAMSMDKNIATRFTKNAEIQGYSKVIYDITLKKGLKVLSIDKQNEINNQKNNTKYYGLQNRPYLNRVSQLEFISKTNTILNIKNITQKNGTVYIKGEINGKK